MINSAYWDHLDFTLKEAGEKKNGWNFSVENIKLGGLFVFIDIIENPIKDKREKRNRFSIFTRARLPGALVISQGNPREGYANRWVQSGAWVSNKVCLSQAPTSVVHEASKAKIKTIRYENLMKIFVYNYVGQSMKLRDQPPTPSFSETLHLGLRSLGYTKEKSSTFVNKFFSYL